MILGDLSTRQVIKLNDTLRIPAGTQFVINNVFTSIMSVIFVPRVGFKVKYRKQGIKTKARAQSIKK